MSITSLIASAIVQYKGDTSDLEDSVRKLKGVQKELAQQELDNSTARNKQLDDWANQLKGLEVALGKMKQAGDFLWDSMKVKQQELRLQTAAFGVDIDRLSASFGGLKTNMELLSFAAQANQSAFRLTNDQLNMVAAATRSLTEKGYDATEVQNAFTNALITGRTRGLEHYGFQMQGLAETIDQMGDKLTPLQKRQEGVNEAMKWFGDLAKDAGTGVGTFGEDADAAAVNLKNAWTSMRESLSSLGESLVPLVESLTKAVGAIEQIDKYATAHGLGGGTLSTLGAMKSGGGAGADFSDYLSSGLLGTNPFTGDTPGGNDIGSLVGGGVSKSLEGKIKGWAAFYHDALITFQQQQDGAAELFRDDMKQAGSEWKLSAESWGKSWIRGADKTGSAWLAAVEKSSEEAHRQALEQWKELHRKMLEAIAKDLAAAGQGIIDGTAQPGGVLDTAELKRQLKQLQQDARAGVVRTAYPRSDDGGFSPSDPDYQFAVDSSGARRIDPYNVFGQARPLTTEHDDGTVTGVAMQGALAGGNPLDPAVINSQLAQIGATIKGVSKSDQNGILLKKLFGEPSDMELVHKAFEGLTTAVTSALNAWISGSESAGKAFRTAIGSAVEAVADQMAVESLKNAAFAIGDLALGLAGDPRAMAAEPAHALAAAEFAAGAAAAAVVAKALGAGAATPSSSSKSGAAGGGVPSTSHGANDNASGPIIVYGDAFADDSPAQRALKARKFVNDALGKTSAGVAA